MPAQTWLLTYRDANLEQAFREHWSSRRQLADLLWLSLVSLINLGLQYTNLQSNGYDDLMFWLIRLVSLSRALPIAFMLFASPSTYGKWRLYIVWMLAIVAISAKAAAAFFIDQTHVPSNLIKLQLVDSMAANLLASLNFPFLTLQAVSCLPLYLWTALQTWLPSKRGLCAQVCHRAAVTPNDPDIAMIMGIINTSNDLVQMLAHRPIVSPYHIPCLARCQMFTCFAGVLLIVCAVVCINGWVEQRARRAFWAQYGGNRAQTVGDEHAGEGGEGHDKAPVLFWWVRHLFWVVPVMWAAMV